MLVSRHRSSAFSPFMSRSYLSGDTTDPKHKRASWNVRVNKNNRHVGEGYKNTKTAATICKETKLQGKDSSVVSRAMKWSHVVSVPYVGYQIRGSFEKWLFFWCHYERCLQTIIIKATIQSLLFMIAISFLKQNWKLFPMSQQFSFLSVFFSSFVRLALSLCFLNCFPHCVDNNLHKIPGRKHIVLDPRLQHLAYSKTPLRFLSDAGRPNENHYRLSDSFIDAVSPTLEPCQLPKISLKIHVHLFQSWPREANTGLLSSFYACNGCLFTCLDSTVLSIFLLQPQERRGLGFSRTLQWSSFSCLSKISFLVIASANTTRQARHFPLFNSLQMLEA